MVATSGTDLAILDTGSATEQRGAPGGGQGLGTAEEARKEMAPGEISCRAVSPLKKGICIVPPPSEFWPSLLAA